LNTVVGLDIGTSCIRAALGEVDDEGNVEIIGIAKKPSTGLRNGVIVNIESACQAIKETIEAAEQNAGYEVTSCITGIGGAQTESLNQAGSAAIASHGKGRREITQGDIDRAIEMATAVYIPLDREMLHIIPREYFVDNLSYGINKPLNTIGARLKADVHIVTASKTAVTNIRSCVNRANYRLDGVMLKTLAASQAVMHDDEMELGSILIDMGAGTTDVLVLMHGAPVCSASIPVGGNLVTNDIAIVKGIPTAEAEKIKVNSGCCWLPGIENDVQVILPGIGGRPPEETSTSELCQIIQPRVEEIFSMVRSAVVHKANLTQLSGNIILTGGGAQMNGVVELAQNVFGTTAVRLGLPEKLGGVEEEYRRPDCATVIGLITSNKNLNAGRDGKKKKRPAEAVKAGQTGEKEPVWKKLKNLFF